MGGLLACCTGGPGTNKDDKVTKETVTVTDGKIKQVKSDIDSDDNEIIMEQNIRVVETRPVNTAYSPTRQRPKAGKVTLVKQTDRNSSSTHPFSSIPIQNDNGEERQNVSSIPRPQKRITIVRDTSNNDEESGTSINRDFSHSEPFTPPLLSTVAQDSPRGRIKIVREYEED